MLIGLLALILALIALAGTAWLWYRNHQALSRLDSRMNTVEQSEQQNVQQVVMPRLSSLSDRVDALAGKLSDSQQTVATLQQQLQSTQARMAKVADRVEGKNQVWNLRSIESLLTAANQRLQLFHDPQGAAQALELADQSIQRASDPRLFKLHNEIVKEIQTVKALPNPDTEQLSLKLANMSDGIATLPLASTMPGEYQNAGHGHSSKNHASGTGKSGPDGQSGGSATSSNDSILGTAKHGWHRFTASVGSVLSQMVTVRRANGTESAPALMGPDQAFFLRQNLQLQLRTADLALLQHDTQAYKQSLSTAQGWLTQYFDTGDSAVSSMIDTLQQLQQTQLGFQAPDISPSLSMVRDLMAAQVQSQPSADASETPAGSTTTGTPGAADSRANDGSVSPSDKAKGGTP